MAEQIPSVGFNDLRNVSTPQFTEQEEQDWKTEMETIKQEYPEYLKLVDDLLVNFTELQKILHFNQFFADFITFIDILPTVVDEDYKNDLRRLLVDCFNPNDYAKEQNLLGYIV